MAKKKKGKIGGKKMEYFVNKQKLPYTCGVLSVFNLIMNFMKDKRQLTAEDEENINKKGRINPAVISLSPSLIKYAAVINKEYLKKNIIVKGYSNGKLGENALDVMTFFEKTDGKDKKEWKKKVLEIKTKKEIKEWREQIAKEYQNRLRKEKITIEKLTPSKITSQIDSFLNKGFGVCVMIGLQKSHELCDLPWTSIPKKERTGYIILDSYKNIPYSLNKKEIEENIAFLELNEFPLEFVAIKIEKL